MHVFFGTANGQSQATLQGLAEDGWSAEESCMTQHDL